MQIQSLYRTYMSDISLFLQGVPAALPNSAAPQIYQLVQWDCCGTNRPLRIPSSLTLGMLCTACVRGRLSPPLKQKTSRAHPTPSMACRQPHSALCRWLYTAHTVKETSMDHWWTVSPSPLRLRVSELWGSAYIEHQSWFLLPTFCLTCDFSYSFMVYTLHNIISLFLWISTCLCKDCTVVHWPGCHASCSVVSMNVSVWTKWEHH